jgi:hypothetical protein
MHFERLALHDGMTFGFGFGWSWSPTFMGDPRVWSLDLVLNFHYDWDESDTLVLKMVSLSSQS